MLLKPIKLVRRSEQTPALFLTPFIDVLLVLVCFILSISFNIHFAVDVSLPESQTGKIVNDETLTAVVKRDGTLVFQGKTLSFDTFPAALSSALKALKPDQKPIAVIQGDEEIPYSLLIQVMDGFRSQGITDISLLTKSSRGP